MANDDEWSDVEDSWLNAETAEIVPIKKGKPAVTTEESKPVTENKPAATMNESKDTANTTGDVPAAEQPAAKALPTIKFARRNCVLVLTNQEDNPAAIGSLRAAKSSACIIQLGSLTQNRETSLALHGAFPRLASGNNPGREQFQRMGFYFYGNAFRTLESDFEITFVTELGELHEILADRVSVLKAIIGKNLYKLQLTYKPQKVVTKAKDDPDEFSMAESSHAAGLFRYLVKCESLTTITLYFCATGKDIDALHDIRQRLKYEKDFTLFNEYRSRNGKIAIQFGRAGCGSAVDVRSWLPKQLNFRLPEHHAVTLAYGEMRDHDLRIMFTRSTLKSPISISFVVLPNSTHENGLPSQYIGFVEMTRLDAFLKIGLFKVGSKATLCFKQPMQTVEPQGWRCEVKPDIPGVKYPGSLVLVVTRPPGNDDGVNVARYPNLNMRAESHYSVWLYPRGSNTPCKRLVNCAHKILYGEPGEDDKHLEKRQDLQKFCAGLEFSSLLKPRAGLFPDSRLTNKKRRELEVLEARCTEDQRTALREIYSCRSRVNIIQGPPGTGKTTFAAEILLRVFKIFGLKTNCYASSDAATDIFASTIPQELTRMRYHGLGMELAGIHSTAAPFQKDGKPPQKEGEPSFRQLTLQMFKSIMKPADCIVTTSYLAGEKFFRESTSPEIVIIDDAGSARELETLMIMYNNLDSADMFIILGDTNQSPVVPSLNHKLNEDDPNSLPYNVFAPQLAISLMARQIANGIRHSTFTKI